MSEAKIAFTLFGNELVFNPTVSFNVFGLTIHWYGVIIAIGMFCGLFYILRRSKEFGLIEDNIIDILLIAIPLGVIGSRILYVMFNMDRFSGDIAGMFKIWEGGLSIYGGIILAIIGFYVYSKKKKIPLGTFLDIACMALIIAQVIGRWGNFINREVYGTETTLPWAMHLTLNGVTKSVHPLFLYESIWNLIGFVFLHFFIKKRKYDGQVFAIYTAWYGLIRFILEGIRAESVLYFFNTDIRVAQMIGIISVFAALGYLLYKELKGNYSPEKLYVNVVNGMDEYDEDEKPEDKKTDTDDEDGAQPEGKEGYIAPESQDKSGGEQNKN